MHEEAIGRRTVLTGAAAFAAVQTLPTADAEAQSPPGGQPGTIYAYVGAFTTAQRKARGNGINVYQMDPDTGGWTHIHLLQTDENPSFLALDREQRFLYSVHADLDQISAYAIDKASGHLTALNKQPCGGKNPVHLSIDPSGRFIVTANYTAGTVGVVPIAKDGSLGVMTDMVALKGEAGPHRTQQSSSHPHNAVFDPAGRFIAVPDKGLDRIFVFRLDAGSGKLTANNPPSVPTQPGAGPRHIAFHPTLPFAYVVNELGSTVATYRYDPESALFLPVQVIPSAPGSHTGENTGAEIAVDAPGHFVYASNRGHNSIGIFAIDPGSGTLRPAGWESTQGKTPRFFTLDPSGNFLYAGNEDTDTVVTFEIDRARGALRPTGQIVKVGSPVTIVFVQT